MQESGSRLHAVQAADLQIVGVGRLKPIALQIAIAAGLHPAGW